MASQVPYSGVPDAAPQVEPLSQVHVDTPLAAFGGTVAGAVEHLGEVASGAGKELFARAEAFQTLDQQNLADQRSADASDKFVQRYLDLSKLKGRQVTDALPGYMQDLDKIRTDGADGLSPYAKQKYLSDTRRFQTNMVWHGGQLARSSFDSADHEATNLLIDKFGDQLSRIDPKDTHAYDTTVKQIRTEAEGLGMRQHGFAPGSPESKEFVDKNVSVQAAKAVVSVSGADQVRAKSMLEQGLKDGTIRPEDGDKIQERIDNAVDGKLGRKIGATAAGGSYAPGSDPKAVVKAARDKAEAADPGNKTLADNAEDAALARFDHEAALHTASVREQQTTLLRGIDGTDSNGKVPLSLEEARSDPKWRDQYDAADPDVQAKAREKIRENQNTNGWIPNDQGNKEYNNLWTRLTDPRSSAKEVDEALNSDVLKTSMTRQQRTEIMKLQEGIINKQSAQENINSAMNIPQVRQALEAAGITKGTDEYNEFAVQFGQAVKNYAEGGHRTVKDNEQLGGIAQQMVYHQASSYIKPWTWGQKNLYENILEAKPELKAQAINAFKKLNSGVEPTEDQLKEMAPMFYQKYFQELGQKSRPNTSKSTERVTPPTRLAAEGGPK